ncbi:MAG: DUF4249 domain-containing protein [Bacteroidetes bacterium]|nr:DUF4249 domain-containing protein [Bacteroidota bacterium]
MIFRKIYRLLLFSIVALLYNGCQKTISIDTGKIKPRLVLNALIEPDSIFKVELSKSRSLMDSSQLVELINSASVKIYEDGVLKTTLGFGIEGIYVAPFKPKQTSSYRIAVDDAEFGHIEATTNIPDQPVLVSAVPTTELTPASSPRYYKYKLVIRDSGKHRDYYYLRAFLIQRGFTPGTPVGSVIAYDIYSDDRVVINDTYTLRGILFDDSAFNGYEYELIIYSPYRVTFANPLWFELSSISKEYYNYLSSIITQNNAGNNPFAEPVIIKSNVQNGTGVFGARNSVYLKASIN